MISTLLLATFLITYLILFSMSNRKAVIFSFFFIAASMVLKLNLNYFELDIIDGLLILSITLFIAGSCIKGNNIRINKYVVVLLIFICWVIISLLLNDMSFISIKRVLKLIMRFGIYVLFIPLILTSEKDFLLSLKYYTLAGVFIAIGCIGKIVVFPGILQNLFLDPWRPESIQFLGWVGHDLGHFISFVIPIQLGYFLIEKRIMYKRLLLISIILTTITMGLSLTKTAWFGFFISVGFFLYNLKRSKFIVKSYLIKHENFDSSNILKENSIHEQNISSFPKILTSIRHIKTKATKYIIVIILVLGIFFLLLPKDTQSLLLLNFKWKDVSGVSRIRLWKGGFNMILNNPILGVGFYNFENNFFAYDIGGIIPIERMYSDPHNWWIRIAAETGLVGFGLFLYFCYTLIVDINKLIKALPVEHYHLKIIGIALLSAFISILVQGLFEATFIWSNYVWAIFALLIIYVRLTKKKLMELVNE